MDDVLRGLLAPAPLGSFFEKKLRKKLQDSRALPFSSKKAERCHFRLKNRASPSLKYDIYAVDLYVVLGAYHYVFYPVNNTCFNQVAVPRSYPYGHIRCLYPE